MKNVFVVILNWNRAGDTISCLETVLKSEAKGLNLQIVVVDNASRDDSVKRLTNFKNKHSKMPIDILKNSRNLGFAAGNNVGIKYALERGASHVLILNNDTLVEKKCLANLFKAAQRGQRIGALSPKIYFARGFEFHKKRYSKSDLGKVIWYAGGVIDWANVYGTPRRIDEVDGGEDEVVQETDYATGTCMLLPREALETVGLFDEKFFLYYEDTDLSVRLRKSGFKILYVPKAVLWHKVSQSSGIGSDLNDYFITRNRLLFGMRHTPLRSKLALFRESIRLFLSGRKWQRFGVQDFYLGKFGSGSWGS